MINYHLLFAALGCGSRLRFLELSMRGRRVRAGFHGASHLRRHLGATPLHSAALSAAFGAAPMLRAKMWLTFAASCAGIVLAGCPPPGLLQQPVSRRGQGDVAVVTVTSGDYGNG